MRVLLGRSYVPRRTITIMSPDHVLCMRILAWAILNEGRTFAWWHERIGFIDMDGRAIAFKPPQARLLPRFARRT